MAVTFLFNLFLIQIAFITISSITYSCRSNSTCGCSFNSAVLTKIIGGEQAGIDTWGWAVSIRLQNNHICGGSLISSTLVLTAAHCLNSIKTKASLSINTGSKYLSPNKHQRSISEIYIHRNFNPNTFVNDIAILRLSSPLNINDRSLALICLPSAATTTKYPPNDTTVVAIGWGVLSVNDKVPSNTLQQVTLKTIAQTADNCRKSIFDGNIQFCAGVQGGGKDTCQGDSGGPLMMFSNSQWQLVGITSYGEGCALSGHAGVYARVSFYEKLISCFLSNDTVCMNRTFVINDSFSFNAPNSFYTKLFFTLSFFVIIQLTF